MEAIKEIFSYLDQFMLALHINKMYVLLWIAAGYIQKTYTPEVITIGKVKLNEVWKTLILGSVFSVIYALLMRDLVNRGTWVEFCASYLFATSLYELFLKNLVNKLLKKVQALFDDKLQ